MGGRKMKKKMVGIFSLLACLLIIFALSVAYAGHKPQGKQRGYGLEKKIYHKLRLVIVNQDELNLSDKQVEKIEDLKISVKKEGPSLKRGSFFCALKCGKRSAAAKPQKPIAL